MPRTIEGKKSAKGLSLAIVVSRFNTTISDRLTAGALAALEESGGDPESVTLVKVPGAFELPLAAQALAFTKKFDAIVCLGAVIRGETAHFDYVSSEMSRGIACVCRTTGIPIGFGVITAENFEQALARSGSRPDNMGERALLAAIEMVDVLRKVSG